MASDDKQTTADRARSRLCGGATPSAAPAARKPAAKKPASKKASVSPSRKKAATRPKATPALEAKAPAAGKGGSNYLGDGMYLYKGRKARKLSVYVSPELVPALKSAGASGKDPRGGDMSEIVESLIREAGYGED